MDKEWKEKTNLDKRNKMMISFYILMCIFEIIVAIAEKDFTWIICAILWGNIAIIEYCNAKLRKGDKVLIDLQENYIKLQTDIINTLLKETFVEIELNKIKIPKHFTKPNQKKLQKRFDYYKKNKKFKVPIIIDNNYTLVDGYTSYLIAKNYNKATVIVKLKRWNENG